MAATFTPRTIPNRYKLSNGANYNGKPFQPTRLPPESDNTPKTHNVLKTFSLPEPQVSGNRKSVTGGDVRFRTVIGFTGPNDASEEYSWARPSQVAQADFISATDVDGSVGLAAAVGDGRIELI